MVVRQFLTAQLPILFEKRAAQHRLGRQPLPSGGLEAVSMQVSRHQAKQMAMLVQPLQHRFQFVTDLVRGENIEYAGLDGAFGRIVGSGGDRPWNQWHETKATRTRRPCPRKIIAISANLSFAARISISLSRNKASLPCAGSFLATLRDPPARSPRRARPSLRSAPPSSASALPVGAKAAPRPHSRQLVSHQARVRQPPSAFGAAVRSGCGLEHGTSLDYTQTQKIAGGTVTCRASRSERSSWVELCATRDREAQSARLIIASLTWLSARSLIVSTAISTVSPAGLSVAVTVTNRAPVMPLTCDALGWTCFAAQLEIGFQLLAHRRAFD